MDLFGNPDAPETEEDAAFIPQTTTPEPEEAFPSPRLMNRFIGHEGVEQDFLKLYNDGRMPHGLIFSGIKGIGKATFAYRLARFLFKNGLPPDPNQGGLFDNTPMAATSMDVARHDRVFSWVGQGAHPDLLTAERAYDETKNRFKASVDVSEVRKIAPFLRMTSSEGGWRVVIIDDADTMNRSAQNALLKILEEPPPNAVLILIAHRLGALIPTIRSRCRVASFKPLEQALIMNELERLPDPMPEKDKARLIELSEGSLGRALYYANAGGLEMLDLALNGMQAFPNFDWPQVHKLAEDLGRPDRDEAFQSFCESIVWVFETLSRSKARGSSLESGILGQQPVFGSILRHSSLEQLVKACENLQSHFDSVQGANLDRRQGVLGAFSMISNTLSAGKI